MNLAMIFHPIVNGVIVLSLVRYVLPEPCAGMNVHRFMMTVAVFVIMLWAILRNRTSFAARSVSGDLAGLAVRALFLSVTTWWYLEGPLRVQAAWVGGLTAILALDALIVLRFHTHVRQQAVEAETTNVVTSFTWGLAIRVFMGLLLFLWIDYGLLVRYDYYRIDRDAGGLQRIATYLPNQSDIRVEGIHLVRNDHLYFEQVWFVLSPSELIRLQNDPLFRESTEQVGQGGGLDPMDALMPGLPGIKPTDDPLMPAVTVWRIIPEDALGEYRNYVAILHRAGQIYGWNTDHPDGFRR